MSPVILNEHEVRILLEENKRRNMRIVKNLFIIIGILIILGYHGCVVKAEKIKELRLKTKYENGEISQQGYEREKEKINYFSTFLDFKQTLKAIDLPPP